MRHPYNTTAQSIEPVPNVRSDKQETLMLRSYFLSAPMQTQIILLSQRPTAGLGAHPNVSASSITVHLRDSHLCGMCTPGDRVAVTGWGRRVGPVPLVGARCDRWGVQASQARGTAMQPNRRCLHSLSMSRTLSSKKQAH